MSLKSPALAESLPLVPPGMQDQSLGREDPLERGMATHSSVLAWRIPWTEEPGGLYSPWGPELVVASAIFVFISSAVGGARLVHMS